MNTNPIVNPMNTPDTTRAAHECREAFESRHTPNLDLKRNEDGSYRYQAAQLAFRDFADGWQASRTTLLADKALVEEMTLAIGRVFIPDGIWNIEEGWKLERVAQAALDVIRRKVG